MAGLRSGDDTSSVTTGGGDASAASLVLASGVFLPACIGNPI